MTECIKYLAYLIISLLFSSITGQEIVGTWNGNLKLPSGELPLIFKISNGAVGYETSIISPNQSSNEFKANTTIVTNDSLYIESKQLSMVYKGLLKQREIDGLFIQLGNSLSLTLKKEAIKKPEVIIVTRPQDPKKPYPYIEEELVFINPKANGIKLSGTLTIPRNAKKPPVVILISGSGPQNRNQELLNHRPFLVLADYLTRKGIAVLRYDDRGTAKSEGTFKGATSLDFASDVEAAMAYLQERSDIATEKIGLIGHSEGGLIAPMVAASNTDIKFIVMLAGPGVSGKEILKSQTIRAAELSGVPKELLKANNYITEIMLSEIYFGTNINQIVSNVQSKSKKYHESLDSSLKSQIPLETIIQQFTHLVNDPWMRNFVKTEPKEFLSKVKVPVLAINGSKDVQVIPEINLPAIEKILRESGHKDHTVKELENLNHLFQHSETGAVSEYEHIDETFDTNTLDLITDWILNRF